MNAANFDFQCPTCKRNLGIPEELPESCPRCGTPLTSLQEILLAAIHFYRQGCQAVRKGSYSQAQEFFEEAANLWNKEVFQRSKFFAGLLAKQVQCSKIFTPEQNTWQP